VRDAPAHRRTGVRQPFDLVRVEADLLVREELVDHDEAVSVK
jgi:hypothetical protein